MEEAGQMTAYHVTDGGNHNLVDPCCDCRG